MTCARPRTLPTPNRHDGKPRRVGIEIEFGGMEEDRAARLIAETLGGTPVQDDTFEWKIADSSIGTLKIYLDTAYRKEHSNLVETGIEMARPVLPLEIVTDPLPPDRIEDVDRLCAALRDAGAEGTSDGVLLGFGLHLNVELPALEIDAVLPTLTAFALLEPVLRDAAPLDFARRVQPFVKPYPRSLVDALVQDAPSDLTGLTRLYLDHTTSRNHGLDALPILRAAEEGLVVRHAHNPAAVAARPAWHYRLPDARISEPDWSVAHEWNKWVGIEEVAADDDCLRDLCRLWQEHRSHLTHLPSHWIGVARDRISGMILDKELPR